MFYSILISTLVVFLVLGLLEALVSLRSGLEFRRFFRKHSSRPPGDYCPPATLILPCRGLDPGFRENIEAFFKLDYPDFQILLVTDDINDPCVGPIEEVRNRCSSVPSKLLVAPRARGRSQKVENLLFAVNGLREKDEVLAFADSDIRPGPEWLRYLVGTLEGDRAGAATGFRWYVPQSGNSASVLRTVWNSGIVSLLREKNCRFAWGGAMALRRETFQRCRVADHWASALSDDYALSQALRAKDRPIYFQPHCLSLSLEDCSWRELLEWTSRQLAITRAHQPKLWGLVFAGQILNSTGLWGGTAVLAWGLMSGAPSTGTLLALGGLIASIYLLGCLKAALRLQAVALIHPSLRRRRLSIVTLGPLASLLTLAGMIRSASSREIVWRGIRYRMVSPRETIVLGPVQRR